MLVCCWAWWLCACQEVWDVRRLLMSPVMIDEQLGQELSFSQVRTPGHTVPLRHNVSAKLAGLCCKWQDPLGQRLRLFPREAILGIIHRTTGVGSVSVGYLGPGGQLQQGSQKLPTLTSQAMTTALLLVSRQRRRAWVTATVFASARATAPCSWAAASVSFHARPLKPWRWVLPGRRGAEKQHAEPAMAAAWVMARRVAVTQPRPR